MEFHRGRDLYLRKHGSPFLRLAWRALWSWFYVVRTAVALLRSGDDPSRWRMHLRQELWPGGGEGIREAAEAFNRARTAEPA